MRNEVGIVHIRVAGEAAEHRLAQQAAQQVPGVLATTAFRQRRPRHIGQPERVIQFAVSKPSGVGGDPAAVEFQLQAAVEIDPKRTIIRFTRRVFHPRAPHRPQHAGIHARFGRIVQENLHSSGKSGVNPHYAQ